jgi:hypothetical protein
VVEKRRTALPRKIEVEKTAHEEITLLKTRLAKVERLADRIVDVSTSIDAAEDPMPPNPPADARPGDVTSPCPEGPPSARRPATHHPPASRRG